jgi:hypothetical protein
LNGEFVSDLPTIAQLVAVISACWAIISGVGAWKREFIGKRKIELAEQTLAQFFEVRDAISFIRNPFSSSAEGKSRERNQSETANESELLDRGYIVVERFGKREQCFSQFKILKYRFMAAFGRESESIFTDTNKIVNSIFVSARMLSTHYWQRQGRVHMESDEFKKHLEEMHRHEGIFWEIGGEEDEINQKLQGVLKRLEQTTAPCFQEPMSMYGWLTRRWGKG